MREDSTLEFGYAYDATILDSPTDHVLERPVRMSQRLKWFLFRIACLTGMLGYVVGKHILALFDR